MFNEVVHDVGLSEGQPKSHYNIVDGVPPPLPRMKINRSGGVDMTSVSEHKVQRRPPRVGLSLRVPH